jgi:hypothetical protein
VAKAARAAKTPAASKAPAGETAAAEPAAAKISKKRAREASQEEEGGSIGPANRPVKRAKAAKGAVGKGGGEVAK